MPAVTKNVPSARAGMTDETTIEETAGIHVPAEMTETLALVEMTGTFVHAVTIKILALAATTEATVLVETTAVALAISTNVAALEAANVPVDAISSATSLQGLSTTKMLRPNPKWLPTTDSMTFPTSTTRSWTC